MKKSPTLLMKELKSIKERIAELHKADLHDSMETVHTLDEEPSLSAYSYEENREAIRKLRERESAIHRALSLFNLETKIPGFDLTISEGLLRLGQLRDEIEVLSTLASRRQVRKSEGYAAEYYDKCCYEVAKAKEDLKAMREERTALQVAIDRVNLTSDIDC